MKKFTMLLMVLSAITISFGQTSTAPTLGDGSVENPYQIHTLDNLYWLTQSRGDWGKHYVQTADIDAEDSKNWDSGSGFSPIGYRFKGFSGVYDGGGYTISNLYIDRDNTDAVGLFGEVERAHLIGITLEDADIQGKNDVGGIVGYSKFSSIVQCVATGNIAGGYSVGGIVGDGGSYTDISYSWSNAEVTGTVHYQGGIAGDLKSNSSIQNSYAIGSVAGSMYVGGLVGKVSSRATVVNSYSTGVVTGIRFVGGLIGSLSNGSVLNSFWDVETSAQDTSKGGTPKSTAEMKNVATYTDLLTVGLTEPWSFIDVANTGSVNMWTIESGNYPTFSMPLLYRSGENCVISGDTIQGIHAGGDGTEVEVLVNKGYQFVRWSDGNTDNPRTDLGVSSRIVVTAITEKLNLEQYKPDGIGTVEDPYRVASLDNLFWMSQNDDQLHKHYIQTQDIDAADTRTWVDGKGLLPIGQRSGFKGTYDGMGYSIRNLYVNRKTLVGVGLFGKTDGAHITGISLENAEIEGYDEVGGVVGSSENSSIILCNASGTVRGQSEVGGLIGKGNVSSVITYSSSNADVYGAAGAAGGLAGYLVNSSMVKNSYSNGVVNGDWGVGGLIGSVFLDGSVENSFSTSLVNGDGRDGGLIASLFSGGKVENSFWDVESSTLDSSEGGTPKSTAEMQNVSTYTDILTVGLSEPWDFLGVANSGSVNMWTIATGQYPKFSVPLFYSGGDQCIIRGDTLQGVVAGGSGTEVEAVAGLGYRFVKWSDGVTESTRRDLNVIRPVSVIAITEKIDLEQFKPAGSGTSEDPFLVATLENLYWVSQNTFDSHTQFLQTADINAGPSRMWSGGKGFVPIGKIDAKKQFVAKYDGNGFLIDSLYINLETDREVGLFGFLYGAEIKNLGVTNVNIIGGNYLGALAGVAYSSEIINCYASGKVNGVDFAGGLVGFQTDGKIENSFSEVDVSGLISVGGLAGGSASMIIRNSYSKGSVVGYSDVGGALGSGSMSTIVNSYSVGSVSGDVVEGGLVGYSYQGVVINSFWATDSSGQQSSDGGEGKLADELKLVSTFTNTSTVGLDSAWDFINNPNQDTASLDIWTINADEYPTHTLQLSYVSGSTYHIEGDTLQRVVKGGNGTSVIAVPSEGYHFVSWSDGLLDSIRQEISVMKNIKVTAQFDINKYSINYKGSVAGDIEGEALQLVEHGGTSTIVTAVPKPGFIFVQWSDGVTTHSRSDSNVVDSFEVTAEFSVIQYTVNYHTDGNGGISGDTIQTIDTGMNGSEVIAVPNEGYHFTGWSDSSTEQNRQELSVVSDMIISAQFAMNIDSGNVEDSLPPDPDTNPSEDPIVSPDSVDTTNVVDTTGSMVDPVAESEIEMYTVQYKVGEHGTLTGDTIQVITSGTSTSLVTAVPADGYHFQGWSDGSTANPRIDTAVISDTTFVAVFQSVASVFLNASVAQHLLSIGAQSASYVEVFVTTPYKNVEVTLYDFLGNRIGHSSDSEYHNGIHRFYWSLSGEMGKALTTGTYIAVAKLDDGTQLKYLKSIFTNVR